MSTELISALIGLLGVIFSAGVSLQLVNWRLQQLEKKVDKHNEMQDKIASISTDIAVIKESLKHIEKEND
jgi:hypothetical protein